MNKIFKKTAKVVSTFVLVVICIVAIPLLFVGDSPPFQTIPEYYFLKAFGIKLLGIIIIGVCATFIMAMWGKLRQLA